MSRSLQVCSSKIVKYCSVVKCRTSELELLGILWQNTSGPSLVLVNLRIIGKYSCMLAVAMIRLIYVEWKGCITPLTITRRQILVSSKLREFADDNFKFDENGRKLSKWVENTVGKGEIAHYEQFLLFPQCFQKACLPGVSKSVTGWEWVKSIN